ncbi:MAG: HD domain-containing protein [Methylococcaceae bacterium]|nr:HD domain-containing protein [Methylococcaceae bacterium]
MTLATESVLLTSFPKKEQEQIQYLIRQLLALKDSDRNKRPKATDVIKILYPLHVDSHCILATLLSDSRFEEKYNADQITARYGKVVTHLVQDIHWLNHLAVYSPTTYSRPHQAETLRRMVLAMTQDIRSIMIKFAYRIQRLRNLSHEDKKVQHIIAHETLEIYAPLANRLGINQFKWELEDLAFRHLESKHYHAIADSLANNRNQRETIIQTNIQALTELLAQENITATLYGRPKHIYSIWNKMQKKHLEFEELYDLLAIRIIVANTTDCYTVLGLAHSHWQYVPKEFDDYIANPKENGYQSLHSVILDHTGNRIELQIRTQDMHEQAELGVAAHWHYKEGKAINKTTKNNISALRKLIDDHDSQTDLLENFKSELFSDRIFVRTPAGDIIDLIKGATPLDFAYTIHTDIGHRCRGAKINGLIKPLTQPLQSGDKVEIITVKQAIPNYNWTQLHLGFLKTPRALRKVRSWFKQQSQPLNTKKRPSQKTPTSTPITPSVLTDQHPSEKFDLTPLLPPSQRHNYKSDVIVSELDNVLTSLAHCCSPAKGDPIIGFISVKKGITIHRQGCRNISALTLEQQSRLLEVNWSHTNTKPYAVPIIITASSNDHLLNNIMQFFLTQKVHISNVTLHTASDATATLLLSVHITDTQQLESLLEKALQLTGIISATRQK